MFASGLGAHDDAERAASMACGACAMRLRRHADLVFVFISKHHVAQAAAVASIIRKALSPTVLVGCTASGVIADATELEDAPSVSILAARLPGVELSTCWTDDLIADEAEEDHAARLADRLGAGDDLRAAFMLADPFSVPLVRLLPSLNAARGAGRSVPIFGGLASASGEPGGNAVLLNDRLETRGGVLVSMRGSIAVDALVSQGCRPFGPTFVITKARRNLIFELGGRPALEVVSATVSDLTEQQREGLKAGLFLGRVVNEYKSHFGRGDFLIRNVVGVDTEHAALAINEQVSVGQTVRLHMRDAQTAHEDLALLLDAQKLYAPPAGVLLITCGGRGRQMFGGPNHDAGAVLRAFAPQPAGEAAAKPGIAIEPGTAARVPLAGFFAAGEIGPLDGTNFVHGQTVCAAIFRSSA
ncbi:MAG: hypothetical protein HBSAPP03_11160 [Phycisphaerae bacterium]|nr:MAG: hypothetical protein HBSAPP03_11160 [Phycisphaerae bacterium]